MSEKKFLEELELLIRSRYPIIWIETSEEARARSLIDAVARKLGKRVFHWDCLEDMREGDSPVKETATPERALEHVRKNSDKAIFVLYDFHPYLEPEHPSVIRRLRRVGFELKRSYKTVIIISPLAKLPMELEKQITLLDLPLPDHEDLMALLRRVLRSVKGHPDLKVDADEKFLERVVKAALGLTMAEAENLFLKAAVSDRKFGPEDLSLILAEKRQVLRKSGVLDYFDTAETMSDVGGLTRLKQWLEARRDAFSEEARSFGLPQPKGLLLLGVQGCGKSLVAKAIASLWQLPLLRLDVGSLFSMYVGSTEANMRKAIKVAETLAPGVLWLDEIEKGLAGLESSGAVDAGVTARIFSSFLLWMQEKTAPVFVVATANDVRRLPPELLRKGRFDDIFFVDLPTSAERTDIFKIHLKKRNREPANFDLGALATKTDNFSGAEVEGVVISGLYKAFAARRELKQADLLEAVEETIPLAKTMAENIQALRNWAAERARPAS